MMKMEGGADWWKIIILYNISTDSVLIERGSGDVFTRSETDSKTKQRALGLLTKRARMLN